MKTLNKLTKESNELKRYVLLNLWLNQYFTSSILDPIRRFEDRMTTLAPDGDPTSTIYDLCRDIRVELQAKTKQLEEVRDKMLRQRDILKVLSVTLELDNDEQLQNLASNLSKLEGLINTNRDYIQRLSDLSESKISLILNDGKSK